MRLFEYFRGRSRTAFGIGTNLTNDLGYEPLQIVIKMTRCNGQPVAKISDEPSKAMDYDPSYVAYLREVFQVPESRRHVARRATLCSTARRHPRLERAIGTRRASLRRTREDDPASGLRIALSNARTSRTAIATACVERIAVHAAADRREGDRQQSMARRERQRAAVARGQHFRLPRVAATPDRSDGVDDVAVRQAIAARDVASPVAHPPSGRHSASSSDRRAMDRAIDAAATQKRRVRGVDDRVDGERRDVARRTRARHALGRRRWVQHAQRRASRQALRCRVSAWPLATPPTRRRRGPPAASARRRRPAARSRTS